MSGTERSAEQAVVEDLEFAYPDCTVCDDGKGDMNTSGDGWWCEICGTTWRRNGMGGKR